MPYFSEQTLREMGFKRLGKKVRISDRAVIYNPESIEIGDNVRVDDFCVVSGKVIFGNNVHLAVFCNVAGGSIGIEFESFSGFAYGVHAFTRSDDYSGKSLPGPLVPKKYQEVHQGAILLRRHAIVGCNSVIFPGVTLEEGCAVGAMSMVDKSTIPWSIYAGIPARKVKDRSQDILQHEAAYLSETESGESDNNS